MILGHILCVLRWVERFPSPEKDIVYYLNPTVNIELCLFDCHNSSIIGHLAGVRSV